MITKQQLFYGEDIKLNDHISVHIPTVEEILDYDEIRYFRMIDVLLCKPSQCKALLHDIGLDYTSISAFDLFCLNCRNLTPETTGILLGELDLSKFQYAVNSMTNEIVLMNPETGVVIDKIIHALITDTIRKMHYFRSYDDKSPVEYSKQELIDMERHELAKQEKEPYEYIVSSIVKETNYLKLMPISAFMMLAKAISEK